MGKSIGGVGIAPALDDRTRDACLHDLGDQYAAGRLSSSELESRIQAALAAETEEELAAAIAEPPVAVPVEDPSTREAPVQLARWGVCLLAFVAGGALVAVVGPTSNVVEFCVGLAVGLLGFVTHWWLTARSTSPDVVEEHASVISPEVRQCPPVLRDDSDVTHSDDDELPLTVVEAQHPPVARLRPVRPIGRGNGVIPTQRTGD
jgi:hypothetical protein